MAPCGKLTPTVVYLPWPPKDPKKRAWMIRANRRLKLWRRLISENLSDYKEYIEDSLPVFSKAPSASSHSNGSQRVGKNYFQLVERFMLLAMRSRRRMGQTMSIDDAIYSTEIVIQCFTKMNNEDVSVPLRQTFANAMTDFYRAGHGRVAGLQKGQDRLGRLMFTLEREDAAEKPVRGVQAPTEHLGSGLVSLNTTSLEAAIVDHEVVEEQVDTIVANFEGTGDILPSHALMSYLSHLVHFKAAQNECMYNMTYGSIVPSPVPEDADHLNRSGADLRWKLNGLRQAPSQRNHGREELLWIMFCL
ncbi:hypothetical protein Y032_0155g3094 [Ancylostoma ceylanicum]|uniref:Uncharacterized protein n=1 Tax=Ancylostoma ceylanicum TaxID=53326 RepID=A0A016SYT1_9BILA|nr:hypothetical protein Y032_0155g3094 [Ancylostoma ceylanicum]